MDNVHKLQAMREDSIKIKLSQNRFLKNLLEKKG